MPNLLLNVNALPETVPDTIEHPERLPAASIFAHRPAHRWWYFPAMHPGEVLALKLHDSDHSVAWRVPHSAFHDPSVRHGPPRESIELRSMAFFTT